MRGPADDHVRQQIERPAPPDDLTREVRADSRPRRPRAAAASASHQRRKTSASATTTTTAAKRAELHHRLERDAQRVGQVVDDVEHVDLEPAGNAHARDAGARDEDRDSQAEPEQIGRMSLRARSRPHVAREIAEEARIEDAFREPPAAVDEREPVAVLPRQDRVQALAR